VAGFIGSPPMNFIPGEVEGSAIKLPFVTFELPAEMREAVGSRRQVNVAIRPERFEDASIADESKRARGVTFRATVDVIEWLGNEQFAYIPYEAAHELEATLHELERELDSERMRSQLVVALDPVSKITDGTEAELWFDPRNVHLFDPESGANLTLTPTPVPADATQ